MSELTESSGLHQRVARSVAPLVTVATFVALLFGGFFWIDGQYARAQQFRQLEQRFEAKVTSDFLQQTQARIWQLEDRVQQRPNDVTAKEELRRLVEEKKRLEKKLDDLEKAR